MMIQSGLPSRYWYHAVSYVVMLQNRTITTALDLKKTLYELWYGRRSSLTQVKPFGCLAYRLAHKEMRNGKFEPVSKPGVFLGASEEENHNFEILDLETKKIYTTHGVTFQALVFPLSKEDKAYLDWDFTNEHTVPIQDELSDIPVSTDQPDELQVEGDDDLWMMQQRSKSLTPKEGDRVIDQADKTPPAPDYGPQRTEDAVDAPQR